ncbi:glucose PTS transporter subunit IIA [Mycoplasmopsis felis]|uniref:PTS transporter subunit IIABC n=1 Tax=Mycoplasmopsis felis TaxID=33923 RepID=UPI002AFDD77E|nr:glucose PTS transporter subunit IIA [Mycoplasmopsis felis]WQQ06155.1 glucose PTS transporter subunit IIA [Mycoplasmopsis felis]
MNSLFKKSSSVKETKKMNNSSSGKLRKILSKISGAFMLPISVMSIAGLFLGVGAAIEGIDKANIALVTTGRFIKQLGDPVFAVLPLLFAAAFVIAFTDEAGVGVFATIISYMVFLAIQSVFIEPEYNAKKQIIGYTVLFEGAGRRPELLQSLVGNSMGVRSLQTSVFGGITIGLTVQYLYNRFHTIQLPKVISFFGGKRFVSIIAIPVSALLAIIYLILWPWIGAGLNIFGSSLGKVPYGFESFIFGFIERSLIPFGLHHVFYSPLWYSSAGGDVNSLLQTWIQTQQDTYGDSFVIGNTLQELINEVQKDPTKYAGDSTASLSLLGFSSSTVDYTLNKVTHIVPLFTFIERIGMKIGRFADGKFSFMIFGLPAAAAAMILAAPKENRKLALGTVVPAAFTSIITGVTEPIEFTFLFLAPLLFWGFHALMAAFSFMFANLAGVHIPMAFSGGILDMLLYGIIPVAKGTNFWWPLVIGLGYIPIYFVVFYFSIKKFDLHTPGRGGNTKLFTKADYLAKSNSDNKTDSNLDPQAYAIVQGFGGTENITAYNNCASRLRYDVKDTSKVDVEKLKSAGAIAVKFEGKTHAQAIMGPVAEQVNAKIQSQRNLIAEYEKKSSDNSELKLEEIKQKENSTTEDETLVKSSNKSVRIQTAAKGVLVPLEELNDGVFSANLMGKGFAVKFDSEKIGNVYSPVDGTVDVLLDSKHAYGITTKEGVKVLVHIGIDTVSLNGEGFKNFVNLGDKIKAGDKLAQVDLEYVAQKKLRSDVIVVVLNEGTMSDFTINEGKTVAETTSDQIGRVR